LGPRAGESTGYIRGSSEFGQDADGVVYKIEVEFRSFVAFAEPDICG
jgi:hypothetical protein